MVSIMGYLSGLADSATPLLNDGCGIVSALGRRRNFHRWMRRVQRLQAIEDYALVVSGNRRW